MIQLAPDQLHGSITPIVTPFRGGQVDYDTYASLLLALGRIGDTVGHALVFRIGLVCSAAALLLVGFAPNYGAMLFFRFLQGVGAALVLSCGAAMARR